MSKSPTPRRAATSSAALAKPSGCGSNRSPPWAGRRAAPRSAARPSGHSRAPRPASPRGWRRRRSIARRRSAAPGRGSSGSPRWCGLASCPRHRRSHGDEARRQRRQTLDRAPQAQARFREWGERIRKTGSAEPSPSWSCAPVHTDNDVCASQNSRGKGFRQRLTEMKVNGRAAPCRRSPSSTGATSRRRSSSAPAAAPRAFQLPERFEQAIDRCAMRTGARDSDAYLADWRRGPLPCRRRSGGCRFRRSGAPRCSVY